MKSTRFLISLGLPLVMTGIAFAAPCDNATPCENPSFNATTQAGWVASASQMSGIKALNSVGPSGNAVGSRYYFAASSSDQGATLAHGALTTSGTGTEVLGSFALASSPQAPGTQINGGIVQQLLGNTNYFFYAQACGSSEVFDSANCSVWVRVGSHSTSPYPTNVFATPSRPADATINSISMRPSVPAADGGSISQIQSEVRNLISGGLNQTGILLPWVGNNLVYVIDNTMYTAGGGFLPNTKYEFRAQVYYPYGVAVPTGGAEQETNIWTTPAQPGTVTTAGVTHCSVQITAQNAAGSPTNPIYTSYNLCASGTGGSCLSGAIGGSGAASDTITRTVVGLNPGTSYTPTAQALVGNGDGTSAGWNSSALRNGSGFSTLAWGGTFDINNVDETSGDAVVSGVNTTGIQTWQIRLNGNAVANGTAGDLNGTHALTGLTPNTVYAATIVLTEASGCSSTLNFSPGSFTTTPFAPTTPASFPGNTFNSLTMSWTDSSANPAGSTYEAQLCTDAGFSSGCQTATVNKPTVSTTFSGLSASTQYFGRVRTRNVSRPTWPDSAWFTVGSATTGGTPGPVFVTLPDLTVYQTSGTVTALGDDPGPDPESTLIYTWTVQTPLGATVSVSPNGTNAAKNATVTFNTAGTYTLLCTISNNNGSDARATPARQLVQVLKGITVSPNNITINAKSNQNFSAAGSDQFGHPMTLPSVNWDAVGSGNITGSGVFAPGGVGINILIRATHNGITGVASINVVDHDVSGAKAFPVPYKSTTGGGTIHFAGLGSDATIRIYTTSGRLVFEHHHNAPTYDWTVRNTSGESIASGVYLYVIESPSTTKNGKLIIIQ